jgi:hypothetical protein
MTNPTFPRHSWRAAVENRQEGVHLSAAAIRILRAKLALRPELEAVDLTSEEIREAITREVDEKLKFSPNGETFVAVGPDRRVWEGDEDTILQKLANSLSARIAAAAAAERPTELTPAEEVAAKLRARGTYSMGVLLCLMAPALHGFV